MSTAEFIVTQGGSSGPVEARTGPTRIDGRAFADDGGAWNPLGASLFWALWGEKHDADRFDQNLAYLAAHGVDYIRILGMVGSASWADRIIDPYATDYWEVAGRLMGRLQRHGLRAQVTIFADAQVMMPSQDARKDFAHDWAAFAEGQVERMMALEVANEAWQNGLDDIVQLRELGHVLNSNTSVPVTLSSMPQVENNINWCEAYGNSGVQFVVIHYDRDTSKGPWRPVRQPWGWPIEYDSGCGMPPTATSNEPIGPQSSVAEDWDPLRLALSYATTFVSANAAYVYHCGAGIRGGGQADLDRGRFANVWEYPDEILTAMHHTKSVLPPGCANWRRENSQWAGMPWDGFQTAVEDGRLMRAYATVGASEVVLVVLEQKADITVRARQGYRLTRHDVLTGQVLSVEDVPAGSSWTVRPVQPGSLFIGTAL